ncbi:MAG: FMN-binding protein [Lachnospiraceae bacterium]|nr:FMN-binding protein [Lachnospiraceae bacterium]
MKNNVKSAVALTVVCVVVVGLLAVTNYFTAPKIEENKKAAANAAFVEVMPEGEGFEEIALPENAPATVTNLYRETSGQGFVAKLVTTSQYSSGDMGITVGIGTDGVIKGVAITSYNETKDFGEYPYSYIGADSALNDIDVFAGATYSSMAFKNAILDTFNMLIANGDISEGQKSAETLMAEMLPVIFPGSCNASGLAQLVEIEGTGFTKAYATGNDTGFVALSDVDGNTVVSVMNAFGVVKCYDLEGNEVSGPVDEVKSAFEVLADKNADNNIKNAYKAYGDESAELTALTDVDAFGSVTGGFSVTTEENTYYIFNIKTFGYMNELMEMAVVLDSEGKVVNYRTVTDLILHGEYFTEHGLKDKEAYLSQFKEVTEDSYSDDLAIVTGATFTSDAVNDSIHSAFDAFKAVKEAE